MRLRLSKLAYADLESVYVYTVDRWGVEQAEDYLHKLWDSLEAIKASPERFRLREAIYPGCRICISGRHAILYRVQGQSVEVARILHGSMDLPRHVPPDFMAD
jgi:toxin ParE1/3/4